ncbi:hypothetical protein JAAARDRAFT_29677 [Jaapia argillacea MUCL 33604]|uniref:prephenate dehydratase n=1 Tax=Jaapia argillacea MUCL 33604 TaxID=933084 RepID=A0A067Q9B8_9AGAM|nr:hypothetical protein JAAARDRAFT_29677 [Jaapia argillacea MUCL 33604]
MIQDVAAMKSAHLKPKVAFLGPVGTYTHEAALQRFGSDAEYTEAPTIAAVFKTVALGTPFGLVPQENSTFGSVVETYDFLASPDVGQSIFVRGEIVLAVQHCLLAPKGTKLADVKRVFSHEQALGQCGRFLSAHLPQADLVKTSSTAAAAQALVSPDATPGDAAICSSICTSIFGLEKLCQGIQDVKTNFTRFFVVSGSLELPLPNPQSTRHSQALLRIQASSQNENDLPDIGKFLQVLSLPATRIDRRPDLSKAPFRSAYMVEIHRRSGHIDGAISWSSELQNAIRRVEAENGEATLLGLW